MKALRVLFIALESGWRAGVKQFRKRRTELTRPAALQTRLDALGD